MLRFSDKTNCLRGITPENTNVDEIMTRYKLINNITGWAVFAVAAAVYLLTIEPTASFWDCGEFITQAYKLEVGHPPGAPISCWWELFSQLAKDPSQVAKMVNSMSALMSAFTILFLFGPSPTLRVSWYCERRIRADRWSNHRVMAVESGALAYLLRHVLVLCRGGRSLRVLLHAYCPGLLADPQVEDNVHKPQSSKCWC